ncbi:hypothetical protein OKA04_00540 [Luteolibacter flavescens]|uniref:Uncharacterized protein n=1 Tax=Luteolibacter flavescens TaxID=1859460 RepID=A0ABT3FJM0_9BACT|nr:hypothetical protein [Luteolibacter flavescens]MCW1883195.1 hypothetical protein [Luteolibacter flavescens]
MSPQIPANITPQRQVAAIPPVAREILIKAIYDLDPAHKVRLRLLESGIKRSDRSVMDWLKKVRIWLDFPGHYPCTTSEVYKAAVVDCRSRNGMPTAAEIAAGWEPAAASRTTQS